MDITAAQLRLIVSLIGRVPQSAARAIIGEKGPRGLSKAEASAAISKLQAIATR